MKKILPLLILFLFQNYPYSSYGQFQSIFGDTIASWNIKHSQLFGDYTDSLVSFGDTIINQKKFQKLKYFTYLNLNPQLVNQVIYLSEDTILGKVWYRSKSDTTERLIVNFSLNQTDSFFVYNIGTDDYYKIDTVYNLNNKKYIVVDFPIFYMNNEKLTFIEGVGTNIGISYTENQWPSLQPLLLCQYKDYIQNYQTNIQPYSNMCNIFTSIAKNTLDNFNVNPNPFKNYININFSQINKHITVQLVNMLGHCVFRNKYSNVNSIVLNLAEVKSGVYFLYVLNDEMNLPIKILKME